MTDILIIPHTPIPWPREREAGPEQSLTQEIIQTSWRDETRVWEPPTMWRELEISPNRSLYWVEDRLPEQAYPEVFPAQVGFRSGKRRA